jgi:hypothetical protein
MRMCIILMLLLTACAPVSEAGGPHAPSEPSRLVTVATQLTADGHHLITVVRDPVARVICYSTYTGISCVKE